MLDTTADQLPRLMECIGSRLMPPAFPAIELDQTVRDEGNAVHWASYQRFTGTLTDVTNIKAPNGIIITADMAEHVDEYLASLDCGEMEAPTDWRGENYTIGARCDHRKYRPDIDTLTIDDLKYGWRLVDPFENWTLIAHAIGTCFALHITPAIIVLRIHQPRPWHPSGKLREWRLSYAELTTYYQRIHERLSAPTDELRAGLGWCAKCHALAKCPAARKANMNAIDAIDLAYSDEMPNDALAFELDTLRAAKAMLSDRLDAIEDMAKFRIKNGMVIDNYASEPGYANRRWKKPVSAALLRALTGRDVSTEPGTVTPAEAKRRGVPDTVISALTERPMTGTKLIRSSADDRAKRLLGR